VDGAASVPIIADEQQPEALPGSPGIYRPRDKARPRVRGLCLMPSLTASLRDRARQEGTTVHGALCAALVDAGRRVPLGWQDVPMRILSPVNIRRAPVRCRWSVCAPYGIVTFAKYRRFSSRFGSATSALKH